MIRARALLFLFLSSLLGVAPAAGAQTRSAAPVAIRGAIAPLTLSKAAELHSILVTNPASSIYSRSGYQTSYGLAPNAEPAPAMALLHSELGFRALVKSEPFPQKILVKIITDNKGALIRHVKRLMYNSLERVYSSGLTPTDRLSAALALSDRYKVFFDGLKTNPSLSAKARREAENASDLLADPQQIIFGLAQTRQAQNELRLWEQQQERLRPASRGPPATSGQAPPAPPELESGIESLDEIAWQVPPFILESQRGMGADAPHPFIVSLAELRAIIGTTRTNLDLIAERMRLVALPHFSDEFRQRIGKKISDRLAAFAESLPGIKARVDRFANTTISTAFLSKKHRRILHVPDHPGLSLSPEPGGLLLRARFKTDIDDAAVRNTIKDSIESYWKGSFQFGDKTHSWRTVVQIEPLKEGEAFPADWLQVLDNKSGNSYASASAISLSRLPPNFTFATPAHEFGHILGLSDEYSEAYVPEEASSHHIQIPASLMGSQKGKVLERHFKTIYQLLRRHRLEKSS